MSAKISDSDLKKILKILYEGGVVPYLSFDREAKFADYKIMSRFNLSGELVRIAGIKDRGSLEHSIASVKSTLKDENI